MDREALRWGSGSWLLLRAVTLLSTFSLIFLDPGPNVAVPGYRPPVFEGVGERVVEPWLRADALWYLKIATQGYGKDDGTLAFFPAFPAATWLIDQAVGNEALAGLLASNLAAWVGLVALFGFVRRLAGAKAAAVAVVGMALFPTAFFLMAPYGEPMLLASGSAALLFALAGRRTASFAAGMVAGLSRPFGFLIVLPLLAIARSGKSRLRWIAPLGPAIGLGLWALYAWRLTGLPTALLDVQGNWSRRPTPFWTTLIEGFAAWRRFTGTDLGAYLLFDLGATLFGLSLIPLTVLALRKLRPGASDIRYGLAAYGAATLAIPLSLPFLPRPLLSHPRFVLALFPLFMGLVLIPGRPRLVLGAASAVGLFVGTTVFLAGRPLF